LNILERIRWVLRAWRYRLKVEKNEIQFLIENLKEGQVAVDIGAHKGAYSYWMSKCVGKEGKVFSFEPQPILYKKLKDLIQNSKKENINLQPLAFSSFVGKRNLILPNGKTSPSASIEKKVELNDSKIEIKTTTLDDFFYIDNNIKVDYLKCDVEGHELNVLKGIQNLLKSNKCIIQIEIFEKNFNSVNSYLLERNFVLIDQFQQRSNYFYSNY
jgi:FkbM family methyltransferase